MKKLILFSMSFLFTTLANAYELSGTMSRDDNGNFSVVLENNYGHEYEGEAIDNGNGVLDVSVEDSNAQIYSGTATKNVRGGYDLSLENDSTGSDAEGTLTLER